RLLDSRLDSSSASPGFEGNDIIRW
ncbi:hypothetical protein PF007_g23128, partial [Phytophthora fragariae]